MKLLMLAFVIMLALSNQISAETTQVNGEAIQVKTTLLPVEGNPVTVVTTQLNAGSNQEKPETTQLTGANQATPETTPIQPGTTPQKTPETTPIQPGTTPQKKPNTKFPKAILDVNPLAALDQMYNVWRGGFGGIVSIAIKNNFNYTLKRFGVTPISGRLLTPLPDIPPFKTAIAVFQTSLVSTTGAVGIIHYKLGTSVLSIAFSVPMNWNFLYAWSNVCAASNLQLQTFSNLLNGQGGCPMPVKAGNYGYYFKVVHFLAYRQKAELQVFINPPN